MATLSVFPSALRRSLPAQQTCLACAKRQASKSARAKRRPQLEVELTANVERLGSAGQRVQVAPGRMRNHLYPSKLALYVLGGRTLHLDGSLSSALSTPPTPAASGQSSSSSPSSAATQLQIVAQLEKIGSLSFTRRTTGQATLHGSVTSQNILSALQAGGIPLTEIDGEWQGESANDGIDHGKIKKLGEYVFNLRFHSKQVPLLVHVREDTSS